MKCRPESFDQEGKLSILQSNHLGHQQSIAHLSETKLNESYLCGLQRKSLLEEARTEWQKITVRYEKMSELRAAQQRRLRQIEQKETDKQNAEKEEQTLFNRFDQLKDAYLLSQVENVKTSVAYSKRGCLVRCVAVPITPITRRWNRCRANANCN